MTAYGANYFDSRKYALPQTTASSFSFAATSICVTKYIRLLLVCRERKSPFPHSHLWEERSSGLQITDIRLEETLGKSTHGSISSEQSVVVGSSVARRRPGVYNNSECWIYIIIYGLYKRNGYRVFVWELMSFIDVCWALVLPYYL